MSDPLYQREIMRLAAQSGSRLRLSGACCHARAANPLCGDEITMDVACTAGHKVEQVGFEVHGCILVQASAELLAATSIGADAQAIERLAADLAAMLKGNRPSPSAPFDGFAIFGGAAAYRNRHSCVLLPLDAMQKAFAENVL